MAVVRAKIIKSKHALDIRKSIIIERLNACQRMYEGALETICDLEKFHAKNLKEARTQVTKEFETFRQALELYRSGYSYSEIVSATGIGRLHIEGKTFPRLITEYAGLELSEHEKNLRIAKCEAVNIKVAAAFSQAKKLHADSDAKHLSQLHKLWKKELKDLQIITKLYQRGLMIGIIYKLTGLPASNWIIENQLPVNLYKANISSYRYRKDYSIPETLTPDCAYVVGVYFACTRVFTEQNGITVRSKNEQQIKDLRKHFEKTFQTTLQDHRTENDQYTLSVGRHEFMKDFLKLLKLNSDKDPLIPFDILKYRSTSRAFLRGYLAFARGSFNSKLHRYSISRANQLKILKGVAIALYCTGIFPTLSGNAERADLCLTDADGLRKLNVLFPKFRDPKDRDPVLKSLSEQTENSLVGAKEYEKIMWVLNIYFPKGKELDFIKLLTLAQIPFTPEQLTQSVKEIIQGWRNGDVPSSVEKISRIKGFIKELYPQETKKEKQA